MSYKLTLEQSNEVVLRAKKLLENTEKYYNVKKRSFAYFDALYSLHPDVANELRGTENDVRFNNKSIHHMVDSVTEVQTGHSFLLYS